MPYIVNMTVEFDTEDEKEARRRAELLVSQIYFSDFVIALSAEPAEEGSISV